MDAEPGKSYDAHTRLRYQDPAIAREYARSQSFRHGPVEWLIGRLEIRQIRAGLELVGRTSTSVVDVPAGSGKLTGLLSARYPDYLAADISAEMMSHIPWRVPKARADVTALPFADGAVDLVVMLRLLHRVPEDVVRAAIGEGLRVARQGFLFSYSAQPTARGLHAAARRGVGRNDNSMTTLSPDVVRQQVEEHGGRVVRDQSISFGLTTERVAACVPGSAPS